MVGYDEALGLEFGLRGSAKRFCASPVPRSSSALLYGSDDGFGKSWNCS